MPFCISRAKYKWAWSVSYSVFLGVFLPYYPWDTLLLKVWFMVKYAMLHMKCKHVWSTCRDSTPKYLPVDFPSAKLISKPYKCHFLYTAICLIQRLERLKSRRTHPHPRPAAHFPVSMRRYQRLPVLPPMLFPAQHRHRRQSVRTRRQQQRQQHQRKHQPRRNPRALRLWIPLQQPLQALNLQVSSREQLSQVVIRVWNLDRQLIHYWGSLLFADIGWSGYGHFRPIVRKPTVQAKPKLHRPVIPAGATVVSTVSKNEYEQRKQEELKAKEASTDQHKSTLGSSLPPQLKVPFFTSTDDVNGFQAMQGSKVGFDVHDD